LRVISTKLGRAHASAGFMHPEPVGPSLKYTKKVLEQSRSSANLKQRCLYVDYRRGQSLLPARLARRGRASRSRLPRRR